MLQIERHFKAVENVPPKNASECWIGKHTSLRGHDHSEGIVAQQCLFYLYATELKRWHTRDERSWRTPLDWRPSSRLVGFHDEGSVCQAWLESAVIFVPVSRSISNVDGPILTGTKYTFRTFFRCMSKASAGTAATTCAVPAA